MASLGDIMKDVRCRELGNKALILACASAMSLAGVKDVAVNTVVQEAMASDPAISTCYSVILLFSYSIIQKG